MHVTPSTLRSALGALCLLLLVAAPGRADRLDGLQANLDGWQVGYEVYQVQIGDTVENIASRFGVSPSSIRSVNRLAEDQRITPGQSLAIILPGKPRPRREEPATVEPASAQTASDDTSFGPRYAVVARACGITSSRPPSYGRILWQCDPGDRVLVNMDQEGYYGVIMLGGSTGWISKDAVQLTDQDVSQDELNRMLQNASGRGAVVQEAMRYMGTPYRYGGRLPNNVDCSLLVQTVFARQGTYLPRTAAEQCEVGQPISTASLQAGDRLYFINRGGRINHTAIYLGDSQFIHASSNRGCVAIDSLSNPYYAVRFYGARR